MPQAADVAQLVEGLLGRQVTGARTPDPVMRGKDVRIVGSYVDDGGSVKAVCLVDLVLGNALGAALALVPEPRVAAAVSAGRVDEDLAENTREVLNVAASLFNSGDRHLKLAGTWVEKEPVPDDVVAFLRVPGRRDDLRLEINGYGGGVLALVTRDEEPAA
jgi:hypothetical protein